MGVAQKRNKCMSVADDNVVVIWYVIAHLPIFFFWRWLVEKDWWHRFGPILAQFVATKPFANTSCNRHVTCRVVRTQAFKSLQCYNLEIEVDELVELIPALVLRKKDVLIYLSLIFGLMLI